MASRILRAARGSTLTCKGWLQEAAYRIIQNKLRSRSRQTSEISSSPLGASR